MEMAFTTLARGHARLVICLHTSVDPPAAEWENMLSQLSALLAAAPDTRQVRMLVVTGGGGPDAIQRVQLGKVWDGRDLKVAVVVPGLGNPLKRGLMTALSWVNPAMAFFTPEQLRQALFHLQHVAELEAVWQVLAGLQAQLAQVSTLQRIARAHALPAPHALSA
ncbi:MAG TPA: hypothetical protein VMF89_15465 [Polyangiales bacterium]|nr:hypothetical protein [Polyangiales bacterium]